LSWSPNGEQIAFSMLVAEEPPVLVSAPAKPDDALWADEPRVTTRLKYERDGSGYIETGYNHYFVVPAVGGSPRQVTLLTARRSFFRAIETKTGNMNSRIRRFTALISIRVTVSH
jgi:hypothetical protein